MNGQWGNAYAPVSTMPSPNPNQALFSPPMLPPRPYAQTNYHPLPPPLPPRQHSQPDYYPLLRPPMPSPDPSAYNLNHPEIAQKTWLVEGSARKQPKPRLADYPTIVFLLLIWGFLALTCVVLLFTTWLGTRSNPGGGNLISSDEIAAAIAFSTLPILLGTILNEVLMERCWRKVECFALGQNPFGRRVPHYDGAKMANHLLAANFGWHKFLKRLFTLRLSLRDLRTLASWMCLRWGTAISIASTQLCVSWTKGSGSTDDGTDPIYLAEKRIWWVFVPVFLHGLAIFGTMAIWFQLPWRLFSDRFNDRGLWQSYEPYLQRVQGGSIAKCDDVAKWLEQPERGRKSLEKTNKPNLQLGAKLRGAWLGLIAMNVPAVLACLYTWHVEAERSTVLRTGMYRFVFHFVFLAQNIFYVVALDFIMWNLSLEGLCKSSLAKPGRPKTRKALKYLGTSAGLLLFFKAFRQRKPWRAAIFTWLFWLQACTMRFLTITYILCVEVLSYGSINDRKGFYDPSFWLGWIIITAMVTYPLMLVWLFCPFQAPICEQDGWRWANIAQPVYSEPGVSENGYYGVVVEVDSYGEESFRATWGMNVQSFNSAKGKKLR